MKPTTIYKVVANGPSYSAPVIIAYYANKEEAARVAKAMSMYCSDDASYNVQSCSVYDGEQ